VLLRRRPAGLAGAASPLGRRARLRRLLPCRPASTFGAIPAHRRGGSRRCCCTPTPRWSRSAAFALRPRIADPPQSWALLGARLERRRARARRRRHGLDRLARRRHGARPAPASYTVFILGSERASAKVPAVPFRGEGVATGAAGDVRDRGRFFHRRRARQRRGACCWAAVDRAGVDGDPDRPVHGPASARRRRLPRPRSAFDGPEPALTVALAWIVLRRDARPASSSRRRRAGALPPRPAAAAGRTLDSRGSAGGFRHRLRTATGGWVGGRVRTPFETHECHLDGHYVRIELTFVAAAATPKPSPQCLLLTFALTPRAARSPAPRRTTRRSPSCSSRAEREYFTTLEPLAGRPERQRRLGRERFGTKKCGPRGACRGPVVAVVRP